MRFEIYHRTTYTYSQPVFLEPHLLRLQPRSDGAQQLLEFELRIDPEPIGRSDALDAEGNIASSVWFAGRHHRFEVVTRSTIATFRENPFDFLPERNGYSMPIDYGDRAALLAPALRRGVGIVAEDHVGEFAADIARRSDGQAIQFLTLLNETIYRDWRVIHREEGNAWSSAETLARREGACRDLAVLFIDACRSLGIASRFVSGYQQGAPEQDVRELHAWAEVFVPGGGWRGYDPTHGLAVSTAHVAVAASISPKLAAPIIGAYRGITDTHFDSEIQISAEPSLRFSQSQQQC